MKNSINDVWYIEDVKSIREDLTDDQCMEVLQQYLDRDHSYDFEILEYIASDLFPEANS